MREGQNGKKELPIISNGSDNHGRYKPMAKENPVRKGRRHKIRVRLMPTKGLPPLNVCARSGYYAPSR